MRTASVNGRNTLARPAASQAIGSTKTTYPSIAFAMACLRGRSAADLDNLPVELNLLILDYLSDIESLANVANAVPSLYRTLLADDAFISTRILRRELPDYLWTHATVAHLARRRASVVGDFDSLATDSDIHALVDGFRNLRDDAPLYRATHAEAAAILRTYDKVVALRDLFVRDCPCTKSQELTPLRDSLQRQAPEPSELERIERAIYMFDIVSSLCRKMVFTEPGNAAYVSKCYDRVSALQKALVERLMAPWELYQVMHVQGYFRRALYGLDRSEYLSERIVPSILARGIDFVHEALCVVGKARLDEFIAPLEVKLLREPQNVFGVVVSRGIHQTWTRMNAKTFDNYRPFCHDGDRLGYQSWKNLENQYQRFTMDNDPNILDLFHNWVATKEGRVDLWAASLWNDGRWDDIELAIHPPRAEWWRGIKHHWNSMAVGFQVLADPGLLANKD
ncbi:phosphoribosylaminoimidazole-succinocarboxamide synthase [Purpureocillium lavendulum]|uniref:Phosphoribosylaminoimidazole-succinocarboxamide synthase n=1 Tax=Purpureocillium lavendulum TaxID=1247861 RepID=A0AB34G6B5_9HYPO|nr:phosphoribosylaminoimidazole-succinocarboxamide synthase [Purpureocillium lavendulum]